MKLTVKSVIAQQCHRYDRVGYFGIPNWCLQKDAACPMFTTFRRCRHFEEAVLPACPDVAAEYVFLAGQDLDTKPGPTRRAICRTCGEAFKTTSNRQQYCSETCAQAGARAKTRERVRRHRQPDLLPV